MDTNPHAVQKDLGRLGDTRRVNFFKILHHPLVQEMHDRPRGRTDSNISHERQILDETTSLTFGRFGGTDHSPVSIMQLTRFCKLSVTANRRIQTTQMRQGTRIGVSVQDLTDTGSCLHEFLLIAPITGSKGVSKTIRDCV